MDGNSKNWSEMTDEELKANFTVPTPELSTTPPRPGRANKPRSRTQFVQFPIEWILRLVQIDANRCTYRLALYLLHEAWRSRSKRVKVTNVGLKEWGVSRHRKRHALDQLKQMNLVSEEHRDRKSPIAILHFPN
jgi:hypothetical protein